MERVHKIWEHPLYREQFQNLQLAESERRFCRHTLEHFLDVARLAYISSLENDVGLPKEIIYAAALLHDIGRYAQITRGISHEKAGAELAGRIMADCGFLPEEISAVQEAILNHRNTGDAAMSEQISTVQEPILNHRNTGDAAMLEQISAGGRKDQAHFASSDLSALLYRADKQSRCCFACPAAGECNWSQEKRNLQITI